MIYSRIQQHLLTVQNPGQYLGGEYGIDLPQKWELDIAFSFPDTYEIAMSNHSLRVLMHLGQQVDGVRSQRVFAPAPDFEEVLKSTKEPLRTLEAGTPLNELDLLGFTIGYELSATNLLTILDRGNIPLRSDHRSHEDPLIIAGGPGITNPWSLAPFLDAVFIGEAEAALPEILQRLIELKSKDNFRASAMEFFNSHPHLWTTNSSSTKVKKATWTSFGRVPQILSIPQSHIPIVHSHGVVEIMRGCPQGCRFCHAGIFYRPFRQKPLSLIVKEIDHLVFKLGFRSITLSSLSSGDYPQIESVIQFLRNRYKDWNISFQLPSLRINSVRLDLLKELSGGKKSGLTFAVETPSTEGQHSLNKSASIESLIPLMKEAKSHGWSAAKLYFMVGLPYSDIETEGEEIISFIKTIRKETKLALSVNIGTFVPKPHTPFQWSRQYSVQESQTLLHSIKLGLKQKGIKVSYQSPELSFLEALVSRGDQRVANIIENAWQKGARMDAWDDWRKKSYGHWLSSILDQEWDVEAEILNGRDTDAKLPWDNISLGPSKEYIKRELKRSQGCKLSPQCSGNCHNHCSICSKEIAVLEQKTPNFTKGISSIPPALLGISARKDTDQKESDRKLLILQFSRDRDLGRFYSQLTIKHLFEQCFQRSHIIPRASTGQKPKPKIQYALALSLGTESEEEFLALELAPNKDLTVFEKVDPSEKGIKALEAHRFSSVHKDYIRTILNKNLPQGVRINNLWYVDYLVKEIKRPSLSNLIQACDYGILFSHEKDNSDLLHYFKEQENCQLLYQSTKMIELRIFSNKQFQIQGILSILRKYLQTRGLKESNPQIELSIESILLRKIWNQSGLVELKSVFESWEDV